ncbi:MAG: hypothetical protein IPJ53_17895 [Saprospiraceae bacterium]|nr:hypothetical protein [Candidatus Vicinibacter affinis]
MFPLLYNEEQFEIAKRLNEQDAVTVKGPPGTGKSQYYSNLISLSCCTRKIYTCSFP